VARVAKEVINGRGERGRKRKIVAREADEPEPEARARSGTDDRSARAMEGTSGADVLSAGCGDRLLQEELKIFALFFGSNGSLEAGRRSPRD
jgi:hypothetical protein